MVTSVEIFAFKEISISYLHDYPLFAENYPARGRVFALDSIIRLKCYISKEMTKDEKDAKIYDAVVLKQRKILCEYLAGWCCY